MVQRVRKLAQTFGVVVLMSLLQGCYYLPFIHPIAPLEYKILLARAKSGNSDAQVKVAGMLICRARCGFGPWLPKCDNAESFKWYQKAANNGNAEAQWHMGMICTGHEAYYAELHLCEDPAESKKWYLKSAEQNYIPAEMSLARIAVDEKRDAEAALWYEKSADAGNATAQLELAKLYAAGRGVEQNTQKARDWAVKSHYDSLEIAKIFAETNPPDYAEAYYRVGLQAAMQKIHGGEGPPSKYFLNILQQADSYKSHLSKAELVEADLRIDAEISAVCKKKLAQRLTYKHRTYPGEEAGDRQLQYCLARQK